MSELLDQVSEIGIGGQLDRSAQMHPHFRTIVATEYGSVMHQCNLQTEPGGTDRRTHACNATADHDKVECSFIMRISITRKQSAAQGLHLLFILRQVVVALRRKIDGITTAVESRQVMQRHLDAGRFYDRYSGILPHPVFSRCTQFGWQPITVHSQLEPPRTLAVMPRRGPVISSDINVICAFVRKNDRRTSIVYGCTRSVSQQIRRPHDIHELLIHDPAALVGKGFGFKEIFMSRESGRKQKSQY